MEEQSAFDEFDNRLQTQRRRDLLPLWIKIFTWMFFFFGAMGFVIPLAGFFLKETNLSLYGFETKDPYSLIGLLICALFILKGTVSYGLWFEKNWAIKLAKADAIIGLILCGISMIIIPFFTRNFTIRLEIAVLIPYFVKLQKIEKYW